LIVEANADLQNTFRQAFKNAGFRALVISNVDRAIERLDDPDSGVGVVVFNAQTVGKRAVEGFNRLLDSPTTRDIPAVLLLDETQVKWAAAAKRSKTRLAVGMPIAMKRLLLLLLKLSSPELFEGKTDEKKAEAAETPAVAANEAEEVKEVKTEDAAEEPKASADESDFPVDDFDAALDAAVDALTATPPVEPEVVDEPEDDYYADYGDYEDYESDGDEEK
jgi:DNA-binding NtrC family response regulator